MAKLEEDEDLHNKLKCDQMTSDELITADNVKISTLETCISEENARVARLTEEIDTLEKDIAASKSEFSDASEDTGEFEGRHLCSSEAPSEFGAATTQSVVLIVPRNTRHILMDFPREKCAR